MSRTATAAPDVRRRRGAIGLAIPQWLLLATWAVGCTRDAGATDVTDGAASEVLGAETSVDPDAAAEAGSGDAAGEVDGGGCPQGSLVTLPAPALGPDLVGVVTSAQWRAYGGSELAFDAAQNGFPITTDGAGNVNHEGLAHMIASPYFPLKGGRRYQVVARLKSDVFPRGQNVAFKLQGPGEAFAESSWNVSRGGVWEDVYLPAYPTADGSWHVEVSVTPLHKFADTPSTMYVDPDIDVFEIPTGEEAVSRHDIDVAKAKNAFSSSTERIDGLGNVYVLREGAWKHVFPRLIYRGTDTDLGAMFGRYKAYGFTGVMDVRTAAQADAVVAAGLDDIAISANDGSTDIGAYWPVVDRVYQWASAHDRHANVLWYNFDDENAYVGDAQYQETLRDQIDASHLDPSTGRRWHPIYYLNGHYGLPRSQAGRGVMDITGSYVGGGLVGEPTLPTQARPTLGIEFLAESQRAPAAVIQLQSYLQEYFVPSLFYGLIQGGRAVSVWRDGTTYGGSKADFRDDAWADAFRAEISPRLDQLLGVLETPQFTRWKASTDHFPLVRVGTRELGCVGYLLLASFAAQDLAVEVSLSGIDAREAVDAFDGSHLAYVANGTFVLPIGHFNAGYRVVRLVAK